MLGKLKEARQRREKATRVAELLIWQHGARGPAMVHHAAMDRPPSEEQRWFWYSVERIAKRLAQLDDLETATTYDIGNAWAQRRGSLIR
jgi:hypothetical protein